MTFREILSAMLRRWYIPLGMLACAAAITVMLARDGGIYTTSTVVSFTRPETTSLSADNGVRDSSVIAFAGAVVGETNDGRLPARYSTRDAPYYGAGVREGALVALANSGSQWVSVFDQSDVEIHVVGRSLDWVETRQKELVDKVLGISSARQAALDLPLNSRITANVAPLTTQITYVAPSRRGQMAAVAAMLAVALITAAWGSITVDRLLSRRRGATGTETQISSHQTPGGTPQ